jgi:hypothetical protein
MDYSLVPPSKKVLEGCGVQAVNGSYNGAVKLFIRPFGGVPRAVSFSQNTLAGQDETKLV